MTAPASMRVMSMFSGIGAIDLGLQRAGFEIIAQCEIGRYACAVLAKRFPGVPNLGDVTQIENYPEADMIAAGFPCQDISNAGKRAGITGTRSGLFGEVVRAVRLVRPKFVLLENVAALHNRGLAEVFGALASLGYDAFADCIPASHVGAPHDRDRTWIVAHAIGSEWREESYRRAIGRMGRVEQSVPWDRDWQSALCEFRRVDDGTTYKVDRVDTLRNAVVPQIPEAIGRAIIEASSVMSSTHMGGGRG